MADFFKWLAQNAGVKHPIASTVIAMVLAGVAWRAFVFYVAGTASPSSQPRVTQTASDAQCTNVVVTGGSASVACSSEKGKTDDTEKKSSGAPDGSH
jgi:hypothetical protein